MQVTVSKAMELITKYFLHYNPHLKQQKFHEAGKSVSQRLMAAGNRIGKTYCGCCETAMHATGIYTENWKGHVFTEPVTIWIASETFTVTRDVLQKMLVGSSLDANSKALIHKSLILKTTMLPGVPGAIASAEIQHASGGISKLFFKSYNQGREKFQGARVNFIHLDEEPPIDIYTECLMRLVDVDGKGSGKLILTMTPLKGYTELMAYFFERQSKNLDNGDEEIIQNYPEIIYNDKYFIQATWDDNPFLTEATKAQLRATLKPYELEAREKGIPSFGSGKVYQIEEKEFTINPLEIPSHWGCMYGMDVGFFAPTAVVFLSHDRDHDIIYVYKEYSNAGSTANVHAGSLMMMGCEWMQGICDPAVDHGTQRDGISLLDDYNKQGMMLIKGSYKKEKAVDNLLDRIRTGRFKVFNNCVKFLDEWRKYSRDDKGKIKKGNDHLMNALEFVICDEENLGLARTKTQAQLNYAYNDQPRWF